jgi:hypothetical protein
MGMRHLAFANNAVHIGAHRTRLGLLYAAQIVLKLDVSIARFDIRVSAGVEGHS